DIARMKSLSLSSIILFLLCIVGFSSEAIAQDCLKVTKKGVVKVAGLNKKGTCGKRGVLLSEIVSNSGVSVTGATGPQGPAGPTGATGAEGPAGPGLQSPLSFNGATFRPRHGSVDWSTSSSCVYQSGGTFNSVFNLALSLPNGATIDSFKYFYFDSSSTYDTELYLTVYDLSGVFHDEWDLISSGSSGDGVAERSDINHVVDNSLYTYVLNWRGRVAAGSQVKLCGVQVYFTPA
ncbi:MAG: collagen-like protein, partial [Bdellovibrionales bacterium]|nr:collagen-like protein [Bdellovibrionales bacterium]